MPIKIPQYDSCIHLITNGNDSTQKEQVLHFREYFWWGVPAEAELKFDKNPACISILVHFLPAKVCLDAKKGQNERSVWKVQERDGVFAC